MTNWIAVVSIVGLLQALSWTVLGADAAGGPEGLKWWVDFLLHLDDKLLELVKEYGVWTHGILFGVIFCETGLVVTPFLPGDSLLFAAGAFAAEGSLRLDWLIPLLIVAAILGDTVNYLLGYLIGERAFSMGIPFLTKANLEKTHAYFEKYGGKTIIVARFVPLIRTFAPFIAGVGAMNYRKFIFFNVIGGIVWVLIFLFLGYWFGSWDFVKKNFELVMVAIVALSLAPPVWEWWCHRVAQKKNSQA